MYLMDMTNVYQGSNALADNYRFFGAIQLSIPCVNRALVAAHGCECPTLIKDGPILFDDGNELHGLRRVEVGHIQVLGQLSAMQSFIKVIVEFWVNDIKLGNGRLLSLEYNATINVMKTIIVVVCLVKKPAVIIEDVF
jgi:hypothetical protein